MAFQGGICEEEGPKVLLVEGKDDFHVVKALLKAHDVERDFALCDCGNDERALSRLNALVPAPGMEVVGLILDANQKGVENRWRSICDKLDRYGYAFPSSPEESGTVIEGDGAKPRLGFWLMPNNRDGGSLEDCCIDFLSEDELSAARDAVALAEERQVARFKEVHRSKAVVHTHLAWQDEPGRPLGLSITRGGLGRGLEQARPFLDWLDRLFGPSRATTPAS